MTSHNAGGILGGLSDGALRILVGPLILVAWLYGTPLLAERRSGDAIVLIASLPWSIARAASRH
jgi:hypothetical protein